MNKLLVIAFLLLSIVVRGQSFFPSYSYTKGGVSTIEDYVLSTGQRFGCGNYSTGGSMIIESGLLFNEWNSTVDLTYGNWSSKSSNTSINTGRVDTLYISYTFPPGQYRWYRAYQITVTDTAYGAVRYFSVPYGGTFPSINTSPVTNIGTTTATANGIITSDGGSPVTSRGFVWNTTGNPTMADNYILSGSGTGAYSLQLTNLTPGQTYYVRAYCSNANGSPYGNEVSFTTSTGASLPVVELDSIRNLNYLEMTGYFHVITDGGAPVTATGLVYNLTGNPNCLDDEWISIGTGTGFFVEAIGLDPALYGQSYFVKAFATNGAGTAYSQARTLESCIRPNSLNGYTFWYLNTRRVLETDSPEVINFSTSQTLAQQACYDYSNRPPGFFEYSFTGRLYHAESLTVGEYVFQTEYVCAFCPDGFFLYQHWVGQVSIKDLIHVSNGIIVEIIPC